MTLSSLVLALALLATEPGPDAGAEPPSTKPVPSGAEGLGVNGGGLETPDAGADPGDPDAPRFRTVVTGTRTEQRDTDSTVATEVITAREIRQAGARDLSELLETQAGVEIERTPRGAGIRLQGMDPEYALVLIDGERAGGRLGGRLDLSRFSLTDVDRVEVVKGPASVLYGSDAMAGVVNLITRKPHQGFEASGRAAYGTRHELDLRGLVGLGTARVTAQLQGGYRTADAYDLDPTDLATNGSAVGTWDVGGALTANPTDRVHLSLRTQYLRKEQQAVDVVPSGAVFDRRERTEAFDAALTASYRHVEGGRLLLRAHTALFRDQLQQDQRSGRDLDQYQDSRERLYELGAQVDHPLGPTLATAGLEALWENLGSPRLSTGSARRMRLGALVQDDWQIRAEPRLTLSGGIRLDSDSQFGLSVSPRLAVRWDAPTPGWTLRGSYGWGFRAPSFTEQYLLFENPSVGYVVEGNPDLRPEHSQGLNLSLDGVLTQWLTLSASAFLTDVRELISIVTTQEATPESPTRFGYENVAAARTQGFELGLRARLVPGLWLDVGYALTDARDLTTREVLEGRALHRGTAQLSWRWARIGFEATVRGALVGRRPFRPDVDGDGQLDLVWTRPYADVDVRLAQRVFSWASVYVLGRNLLGAGDPLYLPLPPRTFQAGVEARY